MPTFHIIVLDKSGQTVLKGDTNFVPKIGEKLISNGYKFKVKDVIYDFGHGTHHEPIFVAVHVELMWEG